MADKLIPLSLPPGLYRNGTIYQSKGRWYDANLVRFTDGTIQPIGGWRYAQDDAGVNLTLLAGIPRGAITWRGAAGDAFLALGTTQKLELLAGGILRDITPVGFVSGRVDTGYGTVSGTYGAGVDGTGAFGVGSATSVLVEADNWQLETFGDYLVAVCTSDKKLYVWAGNVVLPAASVDFSATSGSAPTTCTGVVVTPERFIVILGTGGNVRRVSWASQETYTVWAPLVTNSAGDFDLTTAGKLMCGKRTKNETLLWTDIDLHVMTYIGGPLVYRFSQAGEKCGVISPRAAVTVDTQALWMGRHNFFIYDGFVKPIPCEVRDFVFGDFNEAQAIKVWAMSIAEYGEVWWFYPSASSTEINRYVVYNYREGHWTVGAMRRSAGCDAGALENPVMIAPSGVVFEHEVLQARPGVAGDGDGVILITETGVDITTEALFSMLSETSPLVPYLDSGPVQVGEGDVLMSVQRIVPDERTLGDVQATIHSAIYPTEPEITNGPYSLANPTSVRIVARQVRIRLDEARTADWRVGTLRFGVRPSSRR